MNKIRVIDLLNRIANGEEIPNKIKYDNKIYYIDELEHFYTSKESFNTGLFTDIFYNFNDYDSLNEEVEIIEEDKKIEKLELVNNGNVNAYALLDDWGTKCALTKHSKIMVDKINEIIDYINRGDKE